MSTTTNHPIKPTLKSARPIIAFAVLSLIGALLLLTLFTPASSKAKSTSLDTVSLIAQQHRSDACLLGSLATHLNYVTGRFDWTSRSLALAYKLKYGREDWAKDGNTAHQAQELVHYAGFNPVYGQLTERGADGNSDGLGRLQWLIWSGRYPVVFLDGAVQHAVVVISLVDTTALLYADPFDGQLHRQNIADFYNMLEMQKWYFYATN
jgi:hypothetical protein